MSRDPIVFDVEPDDQTAPNVSEAPPVPDLDAPTAVQASVTALGKNKRSSWGGWIWGLVAGLVTTIATVAAWDYANSLLDRMPVLGLFYGSVCRAPCGTGLCAKELAAVGPGSPRRGCDRVSHGAGRP